MAQIVKFREQAPGDVQMLLKRRKALLRSAPLSPEIAELDRWLVKQPLPIRDLIKIWSRTIRLLLLEYGGGADADRKREILLSLRDQYRTMPTQVREDLWEVWFRWLDEFEQEEIACGERAEGDREFVWTPEARDEMWARIKKERANG